MAFNCTLVTPEQQVLDTPVTQTIFPAHDGNVGILTDRAPMMAKLGVGELRLDLANGQKRIFFIDGGIAQMKDNRLTILTDEAIPQDQIDAESAQAEFTEASALKPTDERSAAEREHRLERARVMQRMSER